MPSAAARAGAERFRSNSHSVRNVPPAMGIQSLPPPNEGWREAQRRYSEQCPHPVKSTERRRLAEDMAKATTPGTIATAAYAKQVARPKNRPDPTHRACLPPLRCSPRSQHAEGDKRQSRKLGADAQRGGIEDGKHVQDECNIGSSAWVRKLSNKTEASTRGDKAPERSSHSPDHVGSPIDAGELCQHAVPAGPSK